MYVKPDSKNQFHHLNQVLGCTTWCGEVPDIRNYLVGTVELKLAIIYLTEDLEGVFVSSDRPFCFLVQKQNLYLITSYSHGALMTIYPWVRTRHVKLNYMFFKYIIEWSNQLHVKSTKTALG